MSIKRKKGGLEVYVYDAKTQKNAYVGRFPDNREGMWRAKAAERRWPKDA
jgi:hypothetical protein